jgi:hypothetical protein
MKVMLILKVSLRAAPPSDVRWRLCPTAIDTPFPGAAPFLRGVAPWFKLDGPGRSQTFRTSGGKAATEMSYQRLHPLQFWRLA